MIPPILQLARRFRALLALGAPPSLVIRFWYWVASAGAREQSSHAVPVLGALIVAVALAGWPGGTTGTVLLAVLGLTFAIEGRFAWIAWSSLGAIDEGLEGLPAEPAALRFPRSHMAFPPLMLFAGSVERRRGIVYLTAPGRRRCVDAYLPKPPARPGELRPAIVQVHGGGWIAGSRAEQGIPLLNHLAANGWVGFSIDYGLSPKATMPDHLIDVKRAIAWVREHAGSYGVDLHHRRLRRRPPQRPRGAERKRPGASAGLRRRRHLGRGRRPLLRRLRLPRRGAPPPSPDS